MNAIIHFTFIFGVVPRDAIEEKRVPRLVRPPFFSSTPAPFLIPESCEENSQLNDRPTDRPCYSAALNFSRTFLIYTWHQHTASQPASRTINSLLPILYPLLHRIRSSVSVGRSLPGSLVDPCLLAGLSVGRFSCSFRLFALRWIHPACLPPPHFFPWPLCQDD